MPPPRPPKMIKSMAGRWLSQSVFSPPGHSGAFWGRGLDGALRRIRPVCRNGEFSGHGSPPCPRAARASGTFERLRPARTAGARRRETPTPSNLPPPHADFRGKIGCFFDFSCGRARRSSPATRGFVITSGDCRKRRADERSCLWSLCFRRRGLRERLGRAWSGARRCPCDRRRRSSVRRDR